MPIYHTYRYIYCSYWSNTTYLVTFPEMTIVRCSRRSIFLKIWRKDNRRIFINVRDCNIFSRGFPVLMASSLRPDEDHFLVNLLSFLYPLALKTYTFPLSKSFVPHSPRQNNFQSSSPLRTLETALFIFSSILNHG